MTSGQTEMWARGVFAAAFLTTLTCSLELQAQQRPTQLTLENALELARQYNPSYRIAVARADATGADVLAGVGQFLPTIDGSLSFSGASQTVFTGTDDFGQPVAEEISRTFQRSSSFQAVDGSIILFDGLQNINNLKSARAGAVVALAGVDREAARVDAEVKRGFYQALQSQRLVVIEEALLAARGDELSATERLFRVVAQSQVDILGAQVEVSRQEQALEAARGQSRKDALSLAEVIGLDELGEVEAVGELPTVFDPAELDRAALIAMTLDRNPRVAEALGAASQADFAASSARGQRWPSISARASFSRAVQESGYGGLFQVDPRDRTFGFGLSVSVPIFSGFQISQRIAQASADERVAEENARSVRLQVEREVRSAFIDLENSYRQVQLAERSADLGRQRLIMAQEEYQLGTRTFTELQQVVQITARDEREALRARLSWANALVTLEELVGQPIHS